MKIVVVLCYPEYRYTEYQYNYCPSVEGLYDISRLRVVVLDAILLIVAEPQTSSFSYV
jgi:hypothetical protein